MSIDDVSRMVDITLLREDNVEITDFTHDTKIVSALTGQQQTPAA